MGADDGLVDAAEATLPDPAEPVDEEVVADVAPAAGLHVVGVDAAQDRRDLGLGVVVGVDRVVHETAGDAAVAQGALVADALVGAPLGAGEDRRLGHGLGLGADRRSLQGQRVRGERPVGALHRQAGVVRLVGCPGARAGLGRLGGGPFGLARAGRARVDEREGEVLGERNTVGAGLDLNVVDVADEHGLGARAGGGGLGAVGVGRVLVVVLEELPIAPVRAGPGADQQGDLVAVEPLTLLPGHPDGREAVDVLGLAHHAGCGGAAGDGAALKPREATAGGREGHLGHGGLHRSGGHRGGHQLRGRLLSRVSADDVEGDHAGGGGEDDEDDTQGQQLLAEGDGTSLKRAHERSTPVWGEGHRQEFHTSHTSHGSVSE